MKNPLNVRSNNIPFLINIIEKGDSYGLDNCLTHEKSEPLVEFYDQRYPHTPLGQFVTRYNITTLIDRGDHGLMLDSGTPDWQIDAPSMKKVSEWLATIEFDRDKKPSNKM